MIWQTARFQIDLAQPRVMGIVNVTPDSFSDGGRHFTRDGGFSGVLAHCERLLQDGAELLDIGGGFPAHYDDTVPAFRNLARTITKELDRLFPQPIV